MGRLKAALIRRYEDDKELSMPRPQSEEPSASYSEVQGRKKTAKIVGKLAAGGAPNAAWLSRRISSIMSWIPLI
jgi:hypothetical protein